MMKIKLNLLIFFFISFAQSQTLSEDRSKYCQSLWDQVGKSDLQKDYQRSKIKNYFSTRFEFTVDYYNNNNSTSILKSFAPLAAFIIIFLILSFVSIIIFVLLTFKRFVLPEERINKQKLLTISFILLLVFFILFIVFCIFFSFAINKVDTVRCGLYLLPSSFIDGVNNQQVKFVGVRGMQQIYQNLNTEITNLTKNRLDFDRIKSADIQGIGNTAYQSLQFFQDKFKNKKTANGLGLQKIPFTAQFIQPSSTTLLKSEFSEIAQTGIKSNQAVVEGKRILNNIPEFQKTTSNISQILSVSAMSIESFFQNVASKANKGLQFIKGSSIALLVFCILAIIISIIIIYILFNITKRISLLKFKQLARILIVVLMLIVFCIFIINIFLSIGSSSVSGFCYLMANISKGNIDYLRNFDTPIDPFIVNVLETCYSPNGDGNVSRLISGENEIQYLQDRTVNNFIEGISSNQYYFNNTYDNLGSQYVGLYSQQLEEFQVGAKIDHFDVRNSLNNLNSLVSCNNNSFELAAQNCSSSTSCQGIYETESFAAPSCSTDQAQANQIFDNLKNYLAQENTLIEEMKNQLTEPKYSPQKSFVKTQETFSQVRQNFENIQRSIPNTLASFQSFSQQLHKISNCQALQIQIDQYENYLCFQFSRYVFALVILNFFLGVVLFMLAWFLCMAFRGDDVYESSQHDLNETQEINLKDTEFVIPEFEEDEKVPKVQLNQKLFYKWITLYKKMSIEKQHQFVINNLTISKILISVLNHLIIMLI